MDSVHGGSVQLARQKVTMRLVSDVGPTGNSTGDHAAWADMVIRKKEKILASRLD